MLFQNPSDRLRDLSQTLQNDIKGLFGSYPQACTAADLIATKIKQTDLLNAVMAQV
jgi:hypothetical protein